MTEPAQQTQRDGDLSPFTFTGRRARQRGRPTLVPLVWVCAERNGAELGKKFP